MDLMLAAMESYHVRHWGKHVVSGRNPAETAGLLWGYVVSRDDMDHVVVAHVSTDTFAKGTSGEVGLNETVTKVKQDVVRKRWPHLSLVGDFHTHPYRNYSEVVQNSGWEFSEGDRDWYESDHTPDSWPGCIAVVMAIGELKRFYEDSQLEAKAVSNNSIRWQIDRFRFWLSGYAIDETGSKDRRRLVVSPRADDANGEHPERPAVYIDVPTINGTNAWFSYQP